MAATPWSSQAAPAQAAAVMGALACAATRRAREPAKTLCFVSFRAEKSQPMKRQGLQRYCVVLFQR